MICSNFTTFAVESPTCSYFAFVKISCDLLKFHYLCGRITNNIKRNKTKERVVICSNFTTFAVESPTYKIKDKKRNSCDLLKFHYLCGRITNNKNLYYNIIIVVICSNFTTFAVESPTIEKKHKLIRSCDLLKFHYLCGRITNYF